MKYKFNTHYFDVIDTPNKAYWLGFIWCDGSMIVRQKKGKYIEYCMKLSLAYRDYEHLVKFNNDIKGNYDIKVYNCSSSYNKNTKEARIAIYNSYFGKILYHKYKMIPYRHDAQTIIKATPPKYYRDLIRGMLDADGSFSVYQSSTKEGMKTKYNLQFGGSESLCRWIEKILIDNNLCTDIQHKFYQRHKDADGHFKTFILSGKQQGYRILHWLYDDSEIYLERKYKRFLDMFPITEKGGDKYAV